MIQRRQLLWLWALSFFVSLAAALDWPHAPQPTQPPALPDRLQPRQAASSTASSSASISIPQTAANGGLSYTKPANTDAVSYYKIAPSNPITFGWNFTGLYVSPSSLTFQAYCSANSYTYPVGPTTGLPGSATEYVWDPYEYQQSANAIPFAQASYTLRVFDEKGLDATPTPGYFYGANSIVNFALYSPAAYTPLASGWTCVACSWAVPSLSALSHPLVVALPVTVGLILIGGAGVLNR